MPLVASVVRAEPFGLKLGQNCIMECVNCIYSATTSRNDKGGAPCLVDSVVLAFWILTFLLENFSL